MSAGRAIVVTREAEQARPWAELLRAAGHAVRELPLIAYEPVEPEPGVDPNEFDWILFTSPQGVRRYAELYPGAWSTRQAALGAGTAARLEALGGRDALGLDCRDGAEFAAAFSANVQPPASLLLPGAERRLSEPTATLALAGFAVRELPLYRTVPLPAERLPESPCAPGDLVFFASPSAVRSFRSAWPALTVDCAAIGESTADAAREAGLEPVVAESPSLAGLCRAAGIELETVNERKRNG